jgi:hypothetical protein
LAESVNFYLNALGDEYAPSVTKQELQQYSPYQTDNVYCVDINFTITDSTGASNDDTNQLQDFLAVQAYAIDQIPVDFNKIAIAYP